LIDPRIFELIETLDAAGLGWLGHEILGDLLAEQEEGSPPEGQARVPDTSREAPLSEDKQVDEAIRLTVKHLTRILDMMSNARDNIDIIAQGRPLTANDARVATLVLKDTKFVSVVDHDGLASAKSLIGDLKDTLDAWAHPRPARTPTPGSSS
jgi:hypothetical protein